MRKFAGISKKLHLALSAALLGVTASASSQAADISKLGCVRDRLPSETVASMGAEATALFLHKPGSQPHDAEMANLYAAAKYCEGTYGWSRESSDIAVYYTQATIMLSVARSMLRGVGYDADALESSFRALRPDLLKSMVSHNPSDEAIQALLSIMKKQSGTYSQERMERAMAFAIELVEVDRQRAAFASS